MYSYSFGAASASFRSLVAHCEIHEDINRHRRPRRLFLLHPATVYYNLPNLSAAIIQDEPRNLFSLFFFKDASGIIALPG